MELSLLSLSSLESEFTGLMAMHIGGDKMAPHIDPQYTDKDGKRIGRGLGNDNQNTAF